MEIERSRSERSRRARGRAMQRREPCPTKKRGVFRWCVCWPNGAKTNRKRSLRLYLQPSEAILPPANVLSQEGLSPKEVAIFGMRSRGCKFGRRVDGSREMDFGSACRRESISIFEENLCNRWVSPQCSGDSPIRYPGRKSTEGDDGPTAMPTSVGREESTKDPRHHGQIL
jgi:hypothetical protein